MDDSELNMRLMAREEISKAPTLDKPLSPKAVRRLAKAVNGIKTKLGEPETDFEVLDEDMYQIPELLFLELKTVADSLNESAALSKFQFDAMDAAKTDKAVLAAALKMEQLADNNELNDAVKLADDEEVPEEVEAPEDEKLNLEDLL